MSKLLVLVLVAAFFAFGKADFATLQEQTEDQLAMSKSRLSNFELFLKDEHKADELYKEVEKECDDVEHQYDLMVAETVKLKEKKDLKGGVFWKRVEPIMDKLSTEVVDVINLVFDKDKKAKLEKMLHDKITHHIIMSRISHALAKFEHFKQTFAEFENFANKP